MRVVHRLSFYGPPPKEAGNEAAGGRKYLNLLVKEDPSRLNAAALAGMLPLLLEFGEDGQIAPFAEAWLRQKPNPADPLWLPAELARLRASTRSAGKATDCR